MATIHVGVLSGSALSVTGDVLVLKYAQALHGLDEVVVTAVWESGRYVPLPKPWDSCVVQSPRVVGASNLVFVGVPHLFYFRYTEIRLFARKAMAALKEHLPHAERALFTIHGVNYGLDEAEAFGAEIAGFVDAVQANEIPQALREVVIIENDHGRAKRLETYLEVMLPGGTIMTAERQESAHDAETREKLRSVGQGSDAKAHVFVAMPFKDDMDDTYHYGIYSAINSAGFICERADLSAFTGDVLDWVKARIRTASLVVADLTDANPNVYLEVGYAWGIGVPTVLLSKSEDHLKFDVKGQRCLIYKKIKQLEDALTSELIALQLTDGIRPTTRREPDHDAGNR